ncbi:MAG: hypothetical protein CVU87_11080 [Firmicutes bacterium HGW-Firmicutes-12]|jgi:UDP-N-acetyl-D-mannosaminuronic acid dehydrogenase|nr:MAG: hypothetical protein CVU87_11080 [Firmicutes bacterium HGW-Firmicutes-12]
MITVIGCGRVGLPLCLYIANKGIRVNGVDTNSTLVNLVQKGEVPFLENGMQELF